MTTKNEIPIKPYNNTEILKKAMQPTYTLEDMENLWKFKSKVKSMDCTFKEYMESLNEHKNKK